MTAYEYREKSKECYLKFFSKFSSKAWVLKKQREATRDHVEGKAGKSANVNRSGGCPEGKQLSLPFYHSRKKIVKKVVTSEWVGLGLGVTLRLPLGQGHECMNYLCSLRT